MKNKGIMADRSVSYKKKSYLSRVHWFIPVIPTTWEVEIGKMWFEASLGKSKQDSIPPLPIQVWWNTTT
jgi:hypothetical protein